MTLHASFHDLALSVLTYCFFSRLWATAFVFALSRTSISILLYRFAYERYCCSSVLCRWSRRIIALDPTVKVVDLVEGLIPRLCALIRFWIRWVKTGTGGVDGVKMVLCHF
jgi:hypothetical protein